MPRIRQLQIGDVGPGMQAEYEKQAALHGRMTNMKRTLAHSPPAFRALMEWYPLFEEVSGFIGERAAILFTHAISAETDCLICSTFFRRILADWGEDPDELELDAREELIVRLGRQLAKDPHGVGDDIFGRLAKNYTESQIVSLVAFGGVMVATNLFNNALRIELDEYLHPYRKPEGGAKIRTRAKAGAKAK